MLEKYGLTAEKIAEKAEKAMKRKKCFELIELRNRECTIKWPEKFLL